MFLQRNSYLKLLKLIFIYLFIYYSRPLGPNTVQRHHHDLDRNRRYFRMIDSESDGDRGGTDKATQNIECPNSSFFVDVQGIYMLIRYIKKFSKKNYPEVPRWVRQQRILCIC